MTTLKRRIPVTLAPDLEIAIERFASRNKLSLSQSITLFLRYGLEMAEDDFFGNLADELDEKTTDFKDHEEFWDELL